MGLLINPYRFAVAGGGGGSIFFSTGMESTAGFDSATGVSIVAARNGNGMRAAFNGQFYKNLGADEAASITLGFAFKCGFAGFGATRFPFVRFYGDGGTTLHMDVALFKGTNVGLEARRAGTTPVAAASSQVLMANTWHYIEIGLTISDTVGVARVDVDGSTVINATGVDTRNAGTDGLIDRFHFMNLGVNADYDDLYAATGATPLGDPGAL